MGVLYDCAAGGLALFALVILGWEEDCLEEIPYHLKSENSTDENGGKKQPTENIVGELVVKRDVPPQQSHNTDAD